MSKTILLNFKPTNGFGWECFAGNLILVASYWECYCELAFINSWTFAPYKSSDSIKQSYELLGTEATINLEMMGKYSPFKYTPKKNRPVSRALTTITNELRQSRPVLVGMDLYFCRWYQYYKSIHSDGHYILITGIDETEGLIYCTDVSLMIYNKAISIEDFVAGYEDDYILLKRSKFKNPLPGESEYLMMIKNTVDKLLGLADNVNRFDSMRIFADRLIDLYKLTMEQLEGNNYWISKLSTDLVKTSQGRLRFVQFLNFVSIKTNNQNIRYFAYELTELGKKWETITYIIFKAFERDGNVKLLQEAAKEIYDVSFWEEHLAQRVLSGMATKLNNLAPKLNIQPTTIHFMVTEKCNLQCKMCDYPTLQSVDEDLPLELIKTLLGDARNLGLEWFELSGGEPMVREDIYEVIATAKSHGIKVSLFTNGTLIGQTEAQKLVDSGLKAVTISLDGFEAVNDHLRGAGNYQKALNAIRHFRTYKEQINEIRVAVVISKYNYQQLYEFTKFLFEDIGITAISFIPFTQWLLHPDKRGNIDEFAITGDLLPDLKRELDKIQEYSRNSSGNFPDDGFFTKVTDYFSGKNLASDSPCDHPLKNCAITPNGLVYPCLTEYIPAGNIKESSFQEIIMNSQYRYICWRAINNKCRGCVLSLVI